MFALIQPNNGLWLHAQEKKAANMAVQIQSPAFENNQVVPRRYSGDGEDVSPELKWSDIPSNAKELALIMDDPDAPTPEPWVHWVICKISVQEKSLPEGIDKKARPSKPQGVVQGKNSWGNIGYGGPSPPRGHGVHHYHFKLYALDAVLEMEPGLTKQQLLDKMKGHVLAEGELIGTFERK
jgi:Raf kinase inhibitor-like YbhB/YbcL family protein